MKTMTKRIVLILLAMALLAPIATGISVSAEQTANPLDNVVFSPCAGYTRVWDAKYPCEGDLVIPEYVGGLPVQYIWSSALNYTNITSVVIPDTVTSLVSGFNFDGCRKMKSVVMSNNVTVIPNNAFSNCDVLETVDLGTGVQRINCNAFINCYKLEYIKLPDTITEIRSYAFGHTGLKCAYFPGTAAQWEQVVVQDYTLQDCILYETSIKEVVSDTNGIKVTAEERPGAKQYTFYRQEKVNGNWTELTAIKTVDSAVYVDTTAVSGHTYRYAVTAANGPYTTRQSGSSKECTFIPVTPPTTVPTTQPTVATTAPTAPTTRPTVQPTVVTSVNTITITKPVVVKPTAVTVTPTTKATVATKAPTIATTKATVATKAPTIATTKATVATKAPTIATTKATVASTAPTIATTKATVASTAPTIATTRATVATTAPTIVTTEPTIITEAPTLVTTEPTVITAAPTIVTTEPTTAATTVTPSATDITEATTPVTNATTTTASTAPSETPPEKISTYSWLLLIIGILSGVIIGGVVVILLFKKK